MRRLFATLLLWMAAQTGWSDPIVRDLELISAHRLQWPGNFQPSGLAWCRDRLLTVSDRHDLEVFEIELKPQARATVKEFLQLDRIPEPPPLQTTVDLIRQMILTVFQKQYDWEGITCDDQGNLYLASEAYSALLKIPPQGASEWITLGSHPVMTARKMLAKPNSGIEGLQWLEQASFMIAAEMNPAGFIRCTLDKDLCKPDQVVVVSDQHLSTDTRTWDISGLSTSDGNLYALERYYSRICRRHGSKLSIDSCVSFKHIEKADAHAAIGATWGQAEGLLITGDRIFVVIDGNGRVLASDPNSTDTWLFELKRPAGF